MTQKDLLQLGCKLLGLYILVTQAAPYAVYVIVGINNTWDSGYLVFAQIIAVFIGYLIFSWVLISKSGAISSKLATLTNELRLEVNKQDILEIAIIMVGLLTLISSSTDIFSKLVQFIYFNEFDKNESNQFWDIQNRKAGVFYSFFKLSVGFAILFTHKSIGRWLMRIGDK